jgi:beta-1,4-mannosyl-glycoprotein beta-1,4-N-acetylglucosaminyltransferase
MPPKLYDCFCYFNEDMLLELRLETLWDIVDYFVIVESIYTISGKPKPLNFNAEKFAKYAAKIRYLVVRDYPDGLDDAWRNERYQRNYIANGLWDAKADDWVMISDVDEIPRPDKIALFNPKRYKRADFEQAAYSYYLNNRCYNQGERVRWYGSKLTTYQNLLNFFVYPERVRSFKSAGWLRSIKRIIFKRWMVQIIPDGGWHFTWVTSIENIILKLESYAHQEFNKPEYKNPETIKAKIAAGFEVLNPQATCQREVVDETFPQAILNNQQKYATWILAPQYAK